MNTILKKVLKVFHPKTELEKFFENIDWKEYNKGFEDGENGQYTFFIDPGAKENKSYKLGMEDGFSLWKQKIFS